MNIIDCGVYPFEIMIFFGDKKKEIIKELKKYLCKSDITYFKTVNLFAGKSIMFSSGQTLLYVNRIPENPNDYATLQHEIFHCACFVLERVGINYSNETDEAYAYLIEYLTKQIYTLLK
jgi:predicted membrane channel-forming protein YqfA (hemolysin III family)